MNVNGNSICAICAGKNTEPVPTLVKTGYNFFESKQPDPVWEKERNVWEEKKGYYNNSGNPTTATGPVMQCEICGTLQPA
ncbi:MAG: hypothetical protein KAS78_03380 [Candidatus Pacebacteria bacterium]|nr:hypothetical protein [Candidatus Paceibacterota bacterium]